MNRFIGSGNFGYVVLGNLQQKTRCQVHVVSGKRKTKNLYIFAIKIIKLKN